MKLADRYQLNQGEPVRLINVLSSEDVLLQVCVCVCVTVEEYKVHKGKQRMNETSCSKRNGMVDRISRFLSQGFYLFIF